MKKNSLLITVILQTPCMYLYSQCATGNVGIGTAIVTPLFQLDMDNEINVYQNINFNLKLKLEKL